MIPWRSGAKVYLLAPGQYQYDINVSGSRQSRGENVIYLTFLTRRGIRVHNYTFYSIR